LHDSSQRSAIDEAEDFTTEIAEEQRKINVSAISASSVVNFSVLSSVSIEAHVSRNGKKRSPGRLFAPDPV
jgi:hypothetical protein